MEILIENRETVKFVGYGMNLLSGTVRLRFRIGPVYFGIILQREDEVLPLHIERINVFVGEEIVNFGIFILFLCVAARHGVQHGNHNNQYQNVET